MADHGMAARLRAVSYGPSIQIGRRAELDQRWPGFEARKTRQVIANPVPFLQGPCSVSLPDPWLHPSQQGATEAKGGARALENSSLKAIVCHLGSSVMALETAWADLEGNLVRAEADHGGRQQQTGLTSGWGVLEPSP